MLRRQTISRLSKEFISATVETELEGRPYDPSNDPVWFAFTAVGVSPENATWEPGQWEVETEGPVPAYLAKCLIGPGGTVQLDVGLYAVHTKINDTPESVIRTVGILEIN